jgi:hypothetical protein
MLAYTQRQPFGPVAHIIPFNHPLMFAAQAIGGALAERQAEHGLRRGALGEPREALDDDRRLSASGTAQHEQWAAGVLDGLTLGGGQHRHRRRIGPDDA